MRFAASLLVLLTTAACTTTDMTDTGSASAVASAPAPAPANAELTERVGAVELRQKDAVVAGRIVAYSWVMVATSLLLIAPLGPSGPLYAVAAVALGAVFLREAHLLRGRVRAGVEVAPMRLFHWSITYLALLFLAVAVDQFV